MRHSNIIVLMQEMVGFVGMSTVLEKCTLRLNLVAILTEICKLSQHSY